MVRATHCGCDGAAHHRRVNTGLFAAAAVKFLDAVQKYLRLSLYRVVTRPLRSTPGRDYAATHIRYALLTQAELLPWCADPELELGAQQVGAAFFRGDVCAGAFDGDKLIGYQFFAFRPTPLSEDVWVEFGPHYRYSYKKLVREEYRGQRIAAGLSSLADGLCRARGYRHTIGYIALQNRSSWRASAHLGSKTVGYAGYVEWFGLLLTFRSPGARRAAFRFLPARSIAGGMPSRHRPRLR